MSDDRRDEEFDDPEDEEAGGPTPSLGAREEKRRPRRRRRGRGRPHSGDLFLALLVFVIVLVFVIFEPKDVVYTLYNRTAGLILIIMVVEYLVLKSMDRTRVYQLENMRLREQRRSDRQTLRRAKEALDEGMRAEICRDEQAQVRWKAKAEVLSEEIGDKL